MEMLSFYVYVCMISADCPRPTDSGVSNLAWIIPVAIIAALLLLGGLILLLVFLIICIKVSTIHTTIAASSLNPDCGNPL